MELFSFRNDAYAFWIQLFDPDRPYQAPYIRQCYGQIASPLYCATRCGFLETTRRLLTEGADVNEKCGLYQNALHGALSTRDDDMVRLLLQHRADINSTSYGGKRVLFWPAENGDCTTAQLLLDYGADVNGQDDKGTTALQCATANYHKTVMELLLDTGANIDLGTSLEM